MKLYRSFLRNVPDAPNRVTVEQTITQLEAERASLEAEQERQRVGGDHCGSDTGAGSSADRRRDALDGRREEAGLQEVVAVDCTSVAPPSRSASASGSA